MGTIVKIICGSCHKEWDCRTGCGLLHGKLENAAGLYQEEIRKSILASVQQTRFPQFDFAYRLAVCKECQDIVSIPVLSLSQTHMKYVGSCENCGKRVELIENVRQTTCLRCKGALESENIGMWD